MSLFDELEKEIPQHCCKTAAFIDIVLSGPERERFDQWIEDGGSMAALHRACTRLGLKCSLTIFKDHVQGSHVPR